MHILKVCNDFFSLILNKIEKQENIPYKLSISKLLSHSKSPYMATQLLNQSIESYEVDTKMFCA